MRRQTWQGRQVIIGNSTFEWRKHEYKLISTEQYLKPEQDGILHVNQIQALQTFPVLVHYYKIKYELIHILDSLLTNETSEQKRRAVRVLRNENWQWPCLILTLRLVGTIVWTMFLM
mgnify:CR=1 FL=1